MLSILYSHIFQYHTWAEELGGGQEGPTHPIPLWGPSMLLAPPGKC